MPLVSLAVALILFEGSLTLHLSEWREIGTVVRRLVTLGALSTWAVITVGHALATGFDCPGIAVRHFDAGYRADGHCADAARGAAQGVDCEHFALGRIPCH